MVSLTPGMLQKQEWPQTNVQRCSASAALLLLFLLQ
jgi:hypothetical protein